MSAPRQALLVIASPKAHQSVSHSLATHLAAQLAGRSVAVQLAYASSPKRSAASIVYLHHLLDEADLLVFVFPLYLDQPPAALVKLLEDYAWHRRDRSFNRSQSMTAIVNSRLPEAHHSDTAVAILKRFAEMEGLQWRGGMALGGSRALRAGRPLAASGFAARHAVKALAKAAAALSNGLPIPQRAVQIMRKPALPVRLYTWAVNRLFQKKARKAGTLHRIQATPYDIAAGGSLGKEGSPTRPTP